MSARWLRNYSPPVLSDEHARIEPAVEDDSKGDPVYIGIGTLVFILVVLLIIYLVRRA